MFQILLVSKNRHLFIYLDLFVVWADNGDECSKQYAGTGALKVGGRNERISGHFNDEMMMIFSPTTLGWADEPTWEQ